MKFSNLFRSVLVFASFVAVAVPNAEARIPISGKWTVAERICTDDHPAKDGFVLGRDTMEFSISGVIVSVRESVAGTSYEQFATFDPARSLMTSQASDGSVSTSLVRIGEAGSLTLFTANFGSGGSCEAGEALLTILQPKN